MVQIISPILKPKFVINICGINYSEDDTILDVPCLNIIGLEDPIKEKSEKLASIYPKSEIVYHSGNHSFPPDKAIYQDIINFIKKTNLNHF